MMVVEELLTEQQIEMAKAHRTFTADMMQDRVVGLKKQQVTDAESNKPVEDQGEDETRQALQEGGRTPRWLRPHGSFGATCSWRLQVHLQRIIQRSPRTTM